MTTPPNPDTHTHTHIYIPDPRWTVEEADRPKVQAERPLKNWGRTFHFTPAVVRCIASIENDIDISKCTYVHIYVYIYKYIHNIYTHAE